MARLSIVACTTMLGAALIVRFQSALAEEILESKKNEIGYATVAEALAALKSRPGVQISQQGGWTIVSEPASATLWSFTPSDNPAHPSAVKRSLMTENGMSYIDMKVHCEASKAACDKLVSDFQQLNQRMAESIRAPPSTTAKPTQGQEKASSDNRGAPEAINITSDSAPGWLPSAEQRVQVPLMTHEFLAALDGGQYLKAYGLMTEDQKSFETLDQFSKRVKEFNIQAGATKERRIIKITWTKDPTNAPAPGVYAAVDLASHFQNIDRHCGYVVLYQSSAVGPFLVSRQEDNFMSNEQARQIAMKQSPQSVDEIWGRLSRNCPNYSASATADRK